jgi:hypothetical protein
MAVEAGWQTLPNWLASEQFRAAMIAEANGTAAWATWKLDAIHGSANLTLSMELIRAMADGAGTWARWPAGTPRSNSTVQLNAAAAVAANFSGD